MKYITLPPIRDKQKEIIPLVFRFRYINRPQFQKLTNEPHQPNMNTRLKQLVENKYLKSLYEETQETKYIPGAYCLGNMGIQYLRSLDYSDKVLKKYYDDDTKSPAFQDKCLFIVDTFLSLLSDSKNLKSEFEFYTKTDFIPEGPMAILDPDFGYAYESKTKVVSYTCQIFETLMSRQVIKNKVLKYFTHFAEEEEESHIIFICPTDHIYKIVRNKTRRLLEEELTDDNIHFWVTTTERMRLGDKGEKIRILN